MNIVIFGPPGAGKGTQSNFLVKKYKYYQLSTGELLRKEISENTEIGKQISKTIKEGNLVSDKLVSSLINRYVSDDTYKNKTIFDGYPRNLNQAKHLEHILKDNGQKINIAFKLSVSLNTIKKRILDRQKHEKRADDSADIAIKRYETYEENIKPVIEFYESSNLLKEVNAEANISQISSEIGALIDAIKG